VCTNRQVLETLEARNESLALRDAGVVFVVDTCVVVTPILQHAGGTMMTNSAKFAHYAPANTGYASVFGALEDCVNSALAGEVVREEGLWQ
jgi:predicted aconitase